MSFPVAGYVASNFYRYSGSGRYYGIGDVSVETEKSFIKCEVSSACVERPHATTEEIIRHMVCRWDDEYDN